MEILWLIIAVLFILWLAGLVLVPITTGMIHILLFLAFILVVLRMVRGERII